MHGDIAAILAELPALVAEQTLPTPMTLAPATSNASYEPKGVVLVLSPWNFPFSLSLGAVNAALAAGNCVVLKPSDHAPTCSALLAKLLPKYIDPDALAVVEGDASVARALLDHRFDHVFFTGGAAIGRVVYQAAAAHLTPCTLELGGSNVAYVHDDIDVHLAARRLLHGALTNAGQFCCGLDTALVHRSTLEPLLAALKATLIAWYGDDPKASSSLGRIVNTRHASRIKALLEPSSHGGTFVAGGEVDVGARYVAPTIVLSPRAGSTLLEDETFAPILCIVPVDGVADAIAFSAERPTALCKYVFARSKAVADEYLRNVRAGMACVNDCMFQGGNPAVPFGGLGASGFGAYHGIQGVKLLSHYCGVLRQPSSSLLDPPFRYPPYTPMKTRLLAFVLSHQPPGWATSLAAGVRSLAYPALVAASFWLGGVAHDTSRARL